MSYNVSLNDPVSDEVLELNSPHQMKGGTYAVGGDTRALLQLKALADLRPDGIWRIE